MYPSKLISLMAISSCIAFGSMSAWAQVAKNQHDYAQVDLVSKREWSQNVDIEARKAAYDLFREGNTLLKDSAFVLAATKYREALKHWDHPGIHFNLALALVNLDQPIEMHQHLVAAMQYGPEPLEKERFEQAKSLEALVEKQLVRVNIQCDVADALVKLDGGQVFVGPGKYEGLLRAGTHRVVASKDGLQTNEVQRTLVGGQSLNLDMKLNTVEELTRYRWKWSNKYSWSFLTGGIVLALAGGGLQYIGVKNIKDADNSMYGVCTDPNNPNCTYKVYKDTSSGANKRSQGERFQKYAMIGYGVGGAAIVTGILLFTMNKKEAYVAPYFNDENDSAQISNSSWEVGPLLDGGAKGFVASYRF